MKMVIEKINELVELVRTFTKNGKLMEDVLTQASVNSIWFCSHE